MNERPLERLHYFNGQRLQAGGIERNGVRHGRRTRAMPRWVRREGQLAQCTCGSLPEDRRTGRRVPVGEPPNVERGARNPGAPRPNRRPLSPGTAAGPA